MKLLVSQKVTIVNPIFPSIQLYVPESYLHMPSITHTRQLKHKLKWESIQKIGFYNIVFWIVSILLTVTMFKNFNFL